MGFAEDEFMEYLRSNMPLMNVINVSELMHELRDVFTDATMERLERDVDRRGNANSLWDFISDLRKRDNWVNRLLLALRNRGHMDLYHHLKAQYESYRPRRILPEPISSSPRSLPPSPTNHTEATQPGHEERYGSLPSQMPPRAVELPTLNQVQPETSSNHHSKESSESSTPPRSFHPVQMDQGASGDDITKTPILETQPASSALCMENNGVSFEVPEVPEPPAVSPLPARRDTEAPQRFPEQNTDQWAYEPKAQILPGTSFPANSVMGAIPKQKRSSAHQEAKGIPRTNPPANSDKTDAIPEPQPSSACQEAKGIPQTNPPANSDRTDSIPEPQPSSARQENPSSSTRPIGNDDLESHHFSKPGVLSSTFVAGKTDEMPPMSRPPVLEISGESQESNRRQSRGSGSPQPPDAQPSHGSSLPQEKPPSDKQLDVRSSPTKRPGEDNANGAYSPSSRSHNSYPSHEPEENSFELPFSDLSDAYTVKYSSMPSADLMGVSDALRHRSPSSPEPTETSNRKEPTKENEPNPSNLENPVVLALSVAVICLSLYIVMLKWKK